MAWSFAARADISLAKLGRGGRARWYVDRLLSMPLPELPHRILQALRQRADRGGRFAARYASAPRALRETPLPRFPLDAVALRGVNADDRARLARQAGDIVGGRLVLLGQRWPTDGRTDWGLDPVSGAHWDWDRFCFDIARRHGDGPGDVKLVWELSRLQHLQVLALDAFLSGTQGSREACVADLTAWMAANPPYRGLGYACGIELAARVISLLVVVALLEPAAFAPPLTAALWDLLQAHGSWLARYPSLYSSANNHLIAEAAGLFALGCLAPGLAGAATWRAMGRAHLEREAARQIHADGVGAEQSPGYQAVTMEWLLVARHIAAATGQRLAPVVDQRLAAGATFLAAILDTAGNHPRLGDEDDSVVLRQDMAPERLPFAIAGAVGALLGIGAACHPSYRLDVRARLLGASRLPAAAWRPVSTTFAAGGYTVLRAGPLMALFDHGPLGYSHTAAHGHADALAVWLHANGTPLLVDAGTFRYNHDAGWRAHLRGTAAHNTVVVDGLEQSEPVGPFNWGRRRACGRLLSAHLDGAPRVTASHDGYAHRGVTHERTVTLTDDLCRLDDRLSGSGRHRVCLTLQFAPGLRVEVAGEGRCMVSSESGPVATVEIAGAAVTVRVETQTARPGPGAVSPAYNTLLPAPALCAEGDVSLPVHLVTTIRMTSRDRD